jgi:peptide chain release factor 1
VIDFLHMSLKDLQIELKELEQQLADPAIASNYKKVAEISKRYADVQRIIESGDTDPVTGIADIIVEIRPGAGGDEAALFAQQLFDMYKNYSEQKGWKLSILDANQTEIGGAKLMVFELSGPRTYKHMRYESGVHRVQRVPVTEKNGRVHTSTATVAVLPKVKEADVRIKNEDLDISFYRSGGPGGQNVNKVSTAVRIIHKPSGITVSSQKERSQPRNKEIAMEILRAKIYEMEQKKTTGDISSQRREQVGTGDRSEKIRTYNFSQDRITDHRIKKNWSNIETIMNGNLDPIFKALIEAYAKS